MPGSPIRPLWSNTAASQKFGRLLTEEECTQFVARIPSAAQGLHRASLDRIHHTIVVSQYSRHAFCFHVPSVMIMGCLIATTLYAFDSCKLTCTKMHIMRCAMRDVNATGLQVLGERETHRIAPQSALACIFASVKADATMGDLQVEVGWFACKVKTNLPAEACTASFRFALFRYVSLKLICLSWMHHAAISRRDKWYQGGASVESMGRHWSGGPT